MANPRKFSEKIALHTHRQAEETARFEQIMKEVSDATARVAPDRGSAKNTLRINNQTLGAFRGGSLPNVSAGATTVKTATKTNKSTKPEDGIHTTHSQTHGHSHTNMSHYRESRARSTAGPIRRPQDRKHDTSPYSSGSFLSPPLDTSWRRTNSDSALHQSAMQGLSNERNENTSGRYFSQEPHHDGRPRSSCEVPRVPGINIYHSAPEPGTVQIPIGNNTGSLPDLTSVHFPSPIHTPLDQDQDQGSSPYSSSPVNTSPATLSPTNVPPGIRPQGHFQFTQVQPNQNHLSVPFNHKYLHHNKGVKVENNLTSLDGPEFIQIGAVSGNIYQQQCPPASPSPTLQQTGTNYRSPRPSPQSSPSLGGRHSAPCSPSAPSPLPNDYQIFNQHQAAQLQQHFEQFSMDWAQLVASLMESGCTWSTQVQVDTPVVNNVSYVDQHTNMQMTQNHPQTLPEVTGIGTIELTADAGYYSTSPSQLVYPTAPPSLHTTPNTPTSIPDIILTDFTDFSTEANDITRHDLTLSKSFEVDLLANETLRQDLEPLDFDGLQMLSDSGLNIIPDGVEDNFRLDRS